VGAELKHVGLISSDVNKAIIVKAMHAKAKASDSQGQGQACQGQGDGHTKPNVSHRTS